MMAEMRGSQKVQCVTAPSKPAATGAATVSPNPACPMALISARSVSIAGHIHAELYPYGVSRSTIAPTSLLLNGAEIVICSPASTMPRPCRPVPDAGPSLRNRSVGRRSRFGCGRAESPGQRLVQPGPLMYPALHRSQGLLKDIQLLVESGKLGLQGLHCQPLCVELQEQDVELGGERRRLFHDLLKGPEHPRVTPQSTGDTERHNADAGGSTQHPAAAKADWPPRWWLSRGAGRRPPSSARAARLGRSRSRAEVRRTRRGLGSRQRRDRPRGTVPARLRPADPRSPRRAPLPQTCRPTPLYSSEDADSPPP